MKNAPFFFFLLVVSLANGQSLFSLAPQTIVAEKPADFFTMYSYATFENLSGTDLNMRWVRTLAAPQPLNGHGIEWGEWSITLQDPSIWHNPATGLDSADFVLPAFPDESNDKFIMQFYPANEPGHLLVKYKVFVIDNPSESVEVTFDYTASVVSSTEVETENGAAKLTLDPNPTSSVVFVKNHLPSAGTLEVLSPSGRLMLTKFLEGNSSTVIDTGSWPAATYLVRMQSENQLYTTRLVVVK